MSFDLYFCWRQKQPIHFDSVAEWSEKHLHFRRERDQLWYSNENTGVYFSLDFEIKDADESVIPSEYFDSGLSFNLNFNRPSFFSYEAMPIVVDLCECFGLVVYDPQEPDGQPINQNPGIAELTRSWLLANRTAVIGLQEHQTAPSLRMPLSSSRYLWNYSRKKQELQTLLGDDIFVPALFPFRRAGSNKVGTMIVCTSGIPMILPSIDWVVIRRTRKKWFGTGEATETGVVSVSVFDTAVADLILPFNNWDPAVRIINPESANAAASRLKSIQDMFPLQEFERVGLDSFVDLEDVTEIMQ